MHKLFSPICPMATRIPFLCNSLHLAQLFLMHLTKSLPPIMYAVFWVNLSNDSTPPWLTPGSYQWVSMDTAYATGDNESVKAQKVLAYMSKQTSPKLTLPLIFSVGKIRPVK